MHSFLPDRGAPSSPVAFGRAWKAASLAAGCWALSCAVILLVSPRPEPPIGLIGASLAALGFIVVLLARAIYLTRSAIRSTGGVLEKRTRELDAVFDGALDSILIIDALGTCRHANAAAFQLLETSREQLCGQSIAAFCAGSRESPISHEAAKEKRDHGRMEMIRSTGATVTVEYAISRNFIPDRHLLVFRDITERRRAEESRNRSLELARSALREAHALRTATLALARELRLNPVLDILLHTLRVLVPYETAQVFLVESNARLFVARETRVNMPESRPDSIETLDAAEYPILLAALRSSNSILIPDTRSSMEWRDLPGGVPVRSWAGVPLRAADQVLGILTVAHSEAGHLVPEHLRISESLAASAAVAIQNARLYERAEIYAAELERRLSDLRNVEQILNQSEADRTASAECFKKVFRFAPIALSVTALEDGRFIEVNETFERQFGYSRNELIGRTSTELDLWPDPAERAMLVANLRHGKKIHAALTQFRTRSGDLRCFLYSAEMIHLETHPCILLACDDPPGELDPGNCS